MRRVADLLKGHEGKTVDEYVSETKALLNDGKLSATTSDARVANDKAIERHVRCLLDAGTERTAFEAALAALDADNQLGKLELFLIANRYRNEPSGGTHEIKFKSLKQARSTIRDIFLERSDALSKRGAIGKLTRRAS